MVETDIEKTTERDTREFHFDLSQARGELESVGEMLESLTDASEAIKRVVLDLRLVKRINGLEDQLMEAPVSGYYKTFR